jgi:hypothetical protein
MPTETPAEYPVMPLPPKKITILHCARCGEDHEIEDGWHTFQRPVEDSDGTIWTWLATCPVTGDPILGKIIPSKEWEGFEAARDADHTDA